MKYLIYCADELWDSLSAFKAFIESKTNHVFYNPEISEIISFKQDKKTLIIFVSDNLLKSPLIGRILQIDLDSIDIFIPVICNGIVLKDGISVPVKTRIGNLHELMQYRDYWYEDWIRLRKLNAIDPGMISENLIEHTRKISGEISPFLKTIALHKPIELLNFEKNNFQFPDERCGLSNEQDQTLKILSENNSEELTLSFDIKKAELDPIRSETISDEESNNNASEIILNNFLIETATVTIFNSPNESLDNMKEENETAETPEQLWEAAIKAKEESDFQNARIFYEQLLKTEPMNAKALRALAVLLDAHFENESAEELFRKAVFCHEENADLYFEYAHHLSKNPQQLHKAADMYQRSIELDETNAKSYLGLAYCQLKSGQKIAAKANYLQACIIDPDSRTAETDTIFAVYNPKPVSAQQQEQVLEIIKNPNEDTVVMVTGATSGIGKAIAEIFAMNGYKVIITGRREDRLEQLKDEFNQRFSAEIQHLCFDIRLEADVHKALERLPQDWKNIDILVNNAGLAKGRAPIHMGNINHWETMIDTNIKGLLYISRLVSLNMVERQRGFIVNIGSVAAKEAYTDGNVYCATKAAVDMLTKGMRLDLHKYGIRVAAVHPGHVETEFALVRFDGDEQKADIYSNFTPLTAADVAETVYYIVNRPQHVNIQDVLMFGTQQASATVVDMSGKKYYD
jgi:NADP-dependent 3-hydroxy acid dehydrogenase YdfG/Tfp pilus assembly protein PilF